MATHSSDGWHEAPLEAIPAIHEHGSDEDGSDNEPLRTRSRSFSEAEDIMNGHGSLSNLSPKTSYYDNFTMDIYSTPPSGLHHRSVTTRSGNGTSIGTVSTMGSGTTSGNTNGSVTGSVSVNGNYANLDDNDGNWRCLFPSHRRRLHLPSQFPTRYQRQHMQHHHAKNSLRRYIFRCSVVIGFTAYIGIFIRGSFLLQREPSKNAEVGPYAMFSPARQIFNQQQLVQRQESILKIAQRATERRQRTRPPTTQNIEINWYNMISIDQEERETKHFPLSQKQEQLPATLDKLCGRVARNASLSDPQSYKASNVLDSNARVLITGILNPVGFHLALHLSQHCGVQAIAGMDSMYPNTLANRLQVQQQIEILMTKIPKFVKPVLLPFLGLDPRSKKDGDTLLNATGELNLLSFKPTHIVHLASYSINSFRTSTLMDPNWKNSYSPYTAEDYDPPLYQIRNAMVAMEQLLMSLMSAQQQQPHFLYASAKPSLAQANNIQQSPSQIATQIVDEVLADTYHSFFGISSIGLRLPSTVYGPGAQVGSAIYDLIDEAVSMWNSTTYSSSTFQDEQAMLDLVFIEDVVEALVAAMQFQATKPLLAQITSGAETSVSSVVATLKSFLPNNMQNNLATGVNQKVQQHQQQQHNNVGSLSGWNPNTPFKHGLLKTVAWQLDQESPFGPSIESGDSLLKRHDVQTCAADDTTCHMGLNYLPCASECSTKDQCLPSIFDNVRDLVHDITEGCDIIMYTQSLGKDLKDLKLQAEYMDGEHLKRDELLICNFAFVPRDSNLVKSVIEKVPKEQLAKFGVGSEEGDAVHERRLDGLNGRLLYRGWILIWVHDAIESLTVADSSLLKLSPSKLFARGVKYAVFVEDNFSVSPTIQDVQFLVSEMNRVALPTRTVHKDEMIQTEDGMEKKRVKYRLPAEPARRAAILFAPLRYPNIADPSKHQYFDPRKKITIRDATKFMRFENDLDPLGKEPLNIRRQREYYERIPSYLNRNDLRSSFEPWYRYSMRHWVRTRWVVHDMELEHSRLLRCDWYQEHVQWDTDLDQLSFAHVMAKRELERRMAHNEPDDHIKTFLQQHEALRDLTDADEWHPMETEHNRLHREPAKWLARIPDHFDKDEEQISDENDPFPKHEQEDIVPLFVRIMSERMMAVSRKAWSRQHSKK